MPSPSADRDGVPIGIADDDAVARRDEQLRAVRDMASLDAIYDAHVKSAAAGELAVFIPDALLTTTIEPRPWRVRLVFTLASPTAGLHFVAAAPTANPPRPAHVFTSSPFSDGGWWFPCMDSWTHRSPMTINVQVPPGQIVVASGQLVDKIAVDPSSSSSRVE